MTKVISILVIGLLAYYWAMTQKLKQSVIRAANQRCREAGVQLLDHTVVQTKLGLVRNKRSLWALQREYLFEFTSTGEHRYQGKVLVLKGFIAGIELEPFSIN